MKGGEIIQMQCGKWPHPSPNTGFPSIHKGQSPLTPQLEKFIPASFNFSSQALDGSKGKVQESTLGEAWSTKFFFMFFLFRPAIHFSYFANVFVKHTTNYETLTIRFSYFMQISRLMPWKNKPQNPLTFRANVDPGGKCCEMQKAKKGAQNSKKGTRNTLLYTFCFLHFTIIFAYFAISI